MLFTTVLKDNKAFQRCFRRGRYVTDEIATAYFYPNGTPFNRVGISVTKKQGNAVERNRIKRIFRADYRLNEEKFPIGYDIVFVGRNNINEKTSIDVENFINKKLLKEINKPFERRKTALKKGGKKKK